jgi:hypothetical protein
MAHPLRKGGFTTVKSAVLGLSAIALIAAPLHADCTELKWRDGLQIALGFDAPPINSPLGDLSCLLLGKPPTLGK